jgi:diguanylate cyclase (GGDEF)-like protein
VNVATTPPANDNQPQRGEPAAQPTRMELGMSEIAALLRSLEETAANSGQSAAPPSPLENQLVQVRLGIASSLFMALRCKHAPSAGHSMRVALGVSAWTSAMGMSEHERDVLEVAALLHDIGKIGVPDHVLQKPGALSPDESALMAHHSRQGIEILGCCCAPPEILEAIQYATAWYDGSREGFDRRGKDLPLGARIIAIVDAFDSMTTDHVYRRAMSRERALVELFQNAGSQFDPDLVAKFSDLHEANQLDLQSSVSQRWLDSLAPDMANQPWELQSSTPQSGQFMPQTLFQQKLLDNMHDGVIFVDSQLRIFLWNQGAERLSGISANAVSQKQWVPSLVELRDERGSVVADEDCPVASALLTGVQSIARLSIAGRNGQDVPINLHAIPVKGRDGISYGATLLLQDASSESTLEEKCQSLHSQTTKDPMTQVANRTEFDRVHDLFLKAHTETGLPCSLIICDIDHFKSVNDNYGHQAGDEAIKNFATLLKSMCRQGDLVARYGGEEFVMLCADCNNATAAARAEQVRRSLADMPHAEMGGRRITASFGVSENQPGDTPETMLRRADRALLQAKDTGRNRVVQLGSGGAVEKPPQGRGWWPFSKKAPDQLVECDLVTAVPLKVAVEKLRGFVADQRAVIVDTGDEQIVLHVDGVQSRRQNDRNMQFIVELKFSTGVVQHTARGENTSELAQTRVHVSVRPKRDRDRRVELATERARDIVSSLRSYLMAHEENVGADEPNG